VRGWTCLVPLLGCLAFLAITLPVAGHYIMHAVHHGSKNTLEAFDITTGLLNTGRSVVDNLLLGSVGIAGFVCPPWAVVVGLAVLAVAAVWWWRRAAGHRRLLVLGLGFILMAYLLMFGVRAEWPYDRLRFWSRYHVFPQLGVALIVCAGLARPGERGELEATDRLSRRQVWTVGLLIAALIVVQLPHGVLGSPPNDPWQREGLRQIEDMDARCRAHHISRDLARKVLPRLHVSGSDDTFNGWNFLRGSDDPHPIPEEEARRLLQP
jgi:hypothetical protein